MYRYLSAAINHEGRKSIKTPKQYTRTTPNKVFWHFALLPFCIFSFLSGNSQQKDLDSLTNKRRSLEKSIDFKETDKNYIRTLYLLATRYTYVSQDSVRTIASKALKLSKEINYQKGIAGSMVALGMADVFQGKIDEGFKKLDEGKNLADHIGADSIYLQSINAFSLGSLLQKDYPRVYENFQQGIIEARQRNSEYWEFTFVLNLATTFSVVKDYDQALTYYNEGLELLKDSNKESGKAEIKSNLGYLYWKTNELEKAKALTNEALPLFEEMGFGAWESFSLITLGGVALKENELQKAIQYFEKALNILEGIEDQKRETDALLGLSEVYLKQANLTKAKEFAERANINATSINYIEGLLQSAEILFKIHKANNEPDKAIAHLEMQQQLSDSIQVAENTTRILMLEAQNKLKRAEIEREEADKKKIERRNIVLFATLLLLVTLATIVFLVRRNIVIQKKTNNELRNSNAAKDKVFSILGNDLKHPIQTLQDLLELYKNDEISAMEIAEITPKLKQNVDENSLMLNNLLLWANTQMGNIWVNINKIQVLEYIESTLASFADQITKKELALSIDVDNKQHVAVDPEHFKVIVQNLVSNAIKFTHNQGEIRIICRNMGEHHKISVCDNGMGMDDKMLARFEAEKHQNHSFKTDNKNRTGLGLLITNELLKLNNGRLEIDSTLNLGSCFHIFLPQTH